MGVGGHQKTNIEKKSRLGPVGAVRCVLQSRTEKKPSKGTVPTRAAGDNELLQAHVNIQVFLEDWKLWRKEEKKKDVFF